MYRSQYRPQGSDHHPCQICNHRGLRRIKVFIINLYKLVDLIEMIRIKIVTLNAEVYFDRFGEELHVISVSLGGFRIETQSRIIALTLWLEEVFTPRLNMVSMCTCAASNRYLRDVQAFHFNWCNSKSAS